MRTLRLLVLVATLLGFGAASSQGLVETVETIARHLADSVQQAGYQSVAVIDPLGPRDESTAFGRFLAEELSGALVNSGRLRVIDRLSLQRILDEQVLSVSGLVNDADAVQRVGDLAGVDVLMLGTYFVLGSSVRLSLKALDVQTAENVAAVNVSVDLDVSIATLLDLTVLAAPSAAGDAGRRSAGASPNVTEDAASDRFFVYDLCDGPAWIEIEPSGTYSRVSFDATPNAPMRFRVRVSVGGRSAFETVHGGVYGSSRPLTLDVAVGPNPATSAVRIDVEKYRQYGFEDWVCQGVIAIGGIATE